VTVKYAGLDGTAVPSKPAHLTVTYTEWHIPDVVLINWFSWWWAQGCSKHVENWNIYEKRTMHQVGYLQEMNRDAWSTKQSGPVVSKTQLTLSRSHRLPKYSWWALHSVSNNLCGRCLPMVQIYIRRRFSRCIPGNQGVGKKTEWGSKSGYNVLEQSLLHIPAINPESSDAQSTPTSLWTSSSSSSSIYHGVGPLVGPFRSHASRSLFKGLPWFLLPVGEHIYINVHLALRLQTKDNKL
jgi:hypothetical protein